MKIVSNCTSVVLRSIEEKDIENLRKWKNKNRTSFFYQEIITEQQQRKWFEKYLKRENDCMFIIETEKEEAIGCMAFRLEKGVIDLYNIIHGEEERGKGEIHNAMYLMLHYIRKNYDCPIKCDVLKDNPAVEWYRKCGFEIKEVLDYYVMELAVEKVPNIEIEIVDGTGCILETKSV